MVVSHGMNVEEVKQLSVTLQGASDQIRTLVTTLNTAVTNATWLGNDATTFKGTWWPEHQSHLNAIAEQLHGFSRSALNNATEQESTSSH